MRIAIVEDEILWQEEIKSRIRIKYGEKIEVNCFSTGTQFLDEIKEYDILFIDIELGMEDGFAISKKYKGYYPDVILIIITSHIELCSKGYKVGTFRYIEKTKLEEFEEAMKSADMKLIKERKVDFHVVSTGIIKVRVKDILYIETYGRNLKLHTYKGEYECVGNISSMGEKLHDYGMFFIHRSCLINVGVVSIYEKRKIILKNGEKLEVSVHRSKEFKKNYLEWKFREADG